MKKKYFYLFFFIVFLFGLFLRFYKLDLRPLHHDEAVNWYFFLKKLRETGFLDFFYEQHGLLPFFLSYLPLLFLKTSISSLRTGAAIFGSLTILLLLFLRKEIGEIGVLISALFLAVSPIMVFYSRFLIGYPFFDFFLLLFLISIFKFFKNFKNRYIFLAFFSLTCLFLTNEASFIFLAIFFAFLILGSFFKSFRERLFFAFKKIKFSTWLLSFLSSIFLFVLIQTSFFKNWSNLFKLKVLIFELIEKSSHTGHNKPFFYYFKVIAELEPYLFVFFVFGLLALKKAGAFLSEKTKLVNLFFLFFSFFTFLIFSLIPYKTPWVLTIIILPFILLTGLSAEIFMKKFGKNKKMILAFSFFIFLSLAFAFHQTIASNFINYAREDKNPLAYVGTTKDIDKLLVDLASFKEKNKLVKPKVLIVASSYWPLPFYLRKNYSLFYATLKDKKEIDQNLANGYDLIIADEKEKPNFDFEKRKNYNLRFGYKIIVYFRKN